MFLIHVMFVVTIMMVERKDFISCSHMYCDEQSTRMRKGNKKYALLLPHIKVISGSSDREEEEEEEQQQQQQQQKEEDEFEEDEKRLRVFGDLLEQHPNACINIEDDMVCEEMVFNRSAKLLSKRLPIRIRFDWRSQCRLSIIFYTLFRPMIKGFIVQARFNDTAVGQFFPVPNRLRNCNGYQNTVCFLGLRSRRFVSLVWLSHYINGVRATDIQILITIFTPRGNQWKGAISLPEYIRPPSTTLKKRKMRTRPPSQN